MAPSLTEACKQVLRIVYIYLILYTEQPITHYTSELLSNFIFKYLLFIAMSLVLLNNGIPTVT